MAQALQEEQQQKVAFPEIRDVADDYAVQDDDFAAQAEAYDAGEDSAIDVDIDNMVWEVETEPQDDIRGDAYSDSIRDFDSGYEAAEDTGAYYDQQEQYGQYDGRPTGYREVHYSRKMNKHLYTWLFSFMLGIYGVDRFVRGQIGLGIFKILTFGGLGFWYLADLGIAIYKSYMSPDSMYNEDLFFDQWGRFV